MNKFLVAYTCNIKTEFDKTYTQKIASEVLIADEDFGITQFLLSRWENELTEKYQGITNINIISFSKLDW